MNKIAILVLFSTLLLVPVGAQQAFAGNTICNSFGDRFEFCNDGNPCTVGDKCGALGLNCIGVPGNGGGACGDPDTTECSNPDTCVAGVCAANNLVKLCDTAAECRTGGFCGPLGNCVLGLPVPNGQACGDDTQTQCSNPDSCFAGLCAPRHVNLIDQVACTNGDCRTNGVCNGLGGCTPGTPDDEGLPCGNNDDTTCANPDFCVLGFCFDNDEIPGTLCNDDGNQCTFGVCGPGIFGPSSCEETPSLAGSPCDNGDGIDCTGVCNLAGSCTNNPSTGNSCNDNNDCTNADTCVAGSCEGAPKLPNTICDDGNACTTGGICVGLPTPTCVNGSPVVCDDDGDICNGSESCNPAIGCVSIPPSTSVCVVGGVGVIIETTPVLIAGVQNTASWLVPIVVSLVGIGLIITRKF